MNVCTYALSKRLVIPLLAIYLYFLLLTVGIGVHTYIYVYIYIYIPTILCQKPFIM